MREGPELARASALSLCDSLGVSYSAVQPIQLQIFWYYLNYDFDTLALQYVHMYYALLVYCKSTLGVLVYHGKLINLRPAERETAVNLKDALSAGLI